MLHFFEIIFAGAAVLGTALAAGSLVYPQTPLPLAVRLTTGSIVVSGLIFLALLSGYASLPVFGVLAGLILAAGLWVKPVWPEKLPPAALLFRILLGFYAVLYLIYVAAPEIQPDAVTYHLGLVREYVRLESFPDRVGFYEILPQGIDMLFVPAYAIARHGGAKVVHFGFLLVLIPLLRRLGRSLGLNGLQADAAAVVLFLAPVLAVAGTSAYTDAALLVFAAVALLMLLQWSREPKAVYLVHGSLAAGFCYCIKPTFGWVAILGFIFVIWRGRRWKPAGIFAALVAVAVAPWVGRAIYETGNPLAPFFNHYFPNDSFREAMDRSLAAAYSAFRPGFSWLTAPLDYALLGGNQGVFGLPFLLVPLAFARKGSRWLAMLSVILLVPWLMNTGSRFLLPAAATGLLALFRMLPDRAAQGLVLIQAVLCFPPLLVQLQPESDWRLEQIPLAAAFGLETERDYLARNMDNYDATELVQQHLQGKSGVLALAPVQQAYIGAPVLVFWHSAQAEDLVNGLVKASRDDGPRSAAMAAVRRAGYRYIIVATDNDPFAAVGRDMLAHPADWNLLPLGTARDMALFWIVK